MKIDWPGAIAFLGAVAAATVAGILVGPELATVLGGLAAGLLIKIGAVDLDNGKPDAQ